MRRMLAADAAEFLQLQPLCHSLAILGGRIVPLFAITALHRDNFSGHKQLLASGSKPNLVILRRHAFRRRKTQALRAIILALFARMLNRALGALPCWRY
jgi:hypothetical protein